MLSEAFWLGGRQLGAAGAIVAEQAAPDAEGDHRPRLLAHRGLLPVFPELSYDPSFRCLVAQLQTQLGLNPVRLLLIDGRCFPPPKHMDTPIPMPIAIAQAGLAGLLDLSLKFALIETPWVVLKRSPARQSPPASRYRPGSVKRSMAECAISC